MLCFSYYLLLFFFFFNDTATTEIYTLSLHDALPICSRPCVAEAVCAGSPTPPREGPIAESGGPGARADRKSTRLNSSHVEISYAVFCLKKKKKTKDRTYEKKTKKKKKK